MPKFLSRFLKGREKSNDKEEKLIKDYLNNIKEQDGINADRNRVIKLSLLKSMTVAEMEAKVIEYAKAGENMDLLRDFANKVPGADIEKLTDAAVNIQATKTTMFVLGRPGESVETDRVSDQIINFAKETKNVDVKALSEKLLAKEGVTIKNLCDFAIEFPESVDTTAYAEKIIEAGDGKQFISFITNVPNEFLDFEKIQTKLDDGSYTAFSVADEENRKYPVEYLIDMSLEASRTKKINVLSPQFMSEFVAKHGDWQEIIKQSKIEQSNLKVLTDAIVAKGDAKDVKEFASNIGGKDFEYLINAIAQTGDADFIADFLSDNKVRIKDEHGYAKVIRGLSDADTEILLDALVKTEDLAIIPSYSVYCPNEDKEYLVKALSKVDNIFDKVKKSIKSFGELDERVYSFLCEVLGATKDAKKIIEFVEDLINDENKFDNLKKIDAVELSKGVISSLDPSMIVKFASDINRFAKFPQNDFPEYYSYKLAMRELSRGLAECNLNEHNSQHVIMLAGLKNVEMKELSKAMAKTGDMQTIKYFVEREGVDIEGMSKIIAETKPAQEIEKFIRFVPVDRISEINFNDITKGVIRTGSAEEMQKFASEWRYRLGEANVEKLNIAAEKALENETVKPALKIAPEEEPEVFKKPDIVPPEKVAEVEDAPEYVEKVGLEPEAWSHEPIPVPSASLKVATVVEEVPEEPETPETIKEDKGREKDE